MRATHKLLAAIAIFFSLAVPALAQSNPGLTYGFVPTAAQWNAYFSSKQDYLGAAACSTAGCTMSGELVTAAPTATTSGFNLPPGTAPSSPINGDLWTTASNIYVRINGVTYALISSGGTVNSGTIGQITYYAASGTAVSGSSAITISGGVPSIASPTITGTATGPDSGTWTSGGINGSVIGATTPEAGTFTTLKASGAATVGTLTAQSGYELTVNGTIAVNVSSTYYAVGYTTGTLTNGHCVSIGSNGTLIDAGGACTTGGGGGTVNAGTAGQIAYYVTSTNAVSGTSAITISGGVATLASPIFSGTATAPDSGTWTSSGINGSVIGASTPESGTFTTLTSTGAASFNSSSASYSWAAITVYGTPAWQVNLGGTFPTLTSGQSSNGGGFLAWNGSAGTSGEVDVVNIFRNGSTNGGFQWYNMASATAVSTTPLMSLSNTGTLNIASGQSYQINGTSVLNATTLGSGVAASSLTSVGTVSSGTWEAAFGGTITGNATLSGILTFSGTDNFAGTFQANGNSITFPGTPASLNYVVGSYTSGDCLKASGTSGGISDAGVPCGILANSALAFTVPTNLQINASVSGNALTLSVVGNNGSNASATNPILIAFRDSTIANGDPVIVSLQAALSFTIASGSTMGCRNSIMCRLWILAINNGGTVALCAYNANSGGTSLIGINEANLQSSASGTSGGNSAQTLYCSTSAVSSKASRIIGYVDISETTAGTWATGPTYTQLFGPGIAKAGQTVTGPFRVSYTSSTGCSVSTFLVPCAAAGSITPSSAANLVKVKVEVSAEPGNQSVSNQIYRAAGGSAACTTAIGSLLAPTGTGTLNFAINISALDQPNSTSQQTYSVCAQATSSFVSGYCANNAAGQTPTCSIQVEEIMGALEPANDNDAESLRLVG